MINRYSLISGHKLILATFLLLVLYPAWIRGGTRVSIQWPMMYIAALLLLLVIVFLFQNSLSKNRACGGITDLFKDPVLYFGSLFLLLLLIQWWNAGRDLVFDWKLMKWVYGPPHIDWLPSAVKRKDAAEMIRWFFPAFALVLTMRHIIKSQHTIRFVLNIMCASASVLAFLGVCQWVLARIWGIGLAPSESYFFTSFGYANHAGIFFVFVLCLSFGFLINTVFAEDRTKTRIVLRSIMALLIFVGATLSASRAALILSWLALILASIYFIGISWLKCSRVAFVNRVSVVVAFLFLSFFFIHGVGQKFFLEEFGDFFDSKSEIVEIIEPVPGINRFFFAGFFGDKQLQRTVALKIWKNNPWFGAGGWSQSYLSTTYLEENQWKSVTDEGLANTHCDPLQFLSEFGVVGAVLMFMTVCCLLLPLWKMRHSFLQNSVFAFCLMGLALVWCYSWVDLPFRSPAVLYLWVIVFAARLSINERGK